MSGRWELSDGQWQLIQPLLRPKRRADRRGRPWQDTRSVLNGVLWILGTGAQGRELPKAYPPYQTCHRRFQNWVREGRLERILRQLAGELYVRGRLKLVEAFIDATFASAKKGAWRLGQPGVARARRFPCRRRCAQSSPGGQRYKAPRRTKADWLRSLVTASSTRFLND